ncbi:alpha-amylase [Agrococcus sp. UYP33]
MRAGVLRRTIAAIGLAAVLALTGCASAAPERRDTGIAMFQWTWDAIAAECPTLGEAGVAWVLTSPPQEHVDGATAGTGSDGSEWWWSYQPVSYRVESRLGTRDELAAMTAACDEAGVDVYADAVINHMAGVESGTGWAGTPFEHYRYPSAGGAAVYDRADFHDCDRTPDDDIDAYREPFVIQHCELEDLADLATESEHVRATIGAYLDDLLSLGVDGFRIDAAKHIDPDDVAAIVAALPEGTPVISEVIRGAGEPVQPEQYTAFSTVWEFGWAERVGAFVHDGSARALADLSPASYGLLEEQARTFVVNHDTERNDATLSYRDGAELSAATAVMLASDDGMPTLYSGYAFSDRDQGPQLEPDGSVSVASCTGEEHPDVVAGDGWADGTWVCQHRWPGTLGLVAWRSRVVDAPLTAVEAHTRDGMLGAAVSYARGSTGLAVVNVSEHRLALAVPTALPDGMYCDAARPGCVRIGVEDGEAGIALEPWQAVAIDRFTRP